MDSLLVNYPKLVFVWSQAIPHCLTAALFHYPPPSAKQTIWNGEGFCFDVSIHLEHLYAPCNLTLIFAAPIPCTDFQLASESMVTSSMGVELNVFNMAQMYWSISSPSVSAGLLHIRMMQRENWKLALSKLLIAFWVQHLWENLSLPPAPLSLYLPLTNLLAHRATPTATLPIQM